MARGTNYIELAITVVVLYAAYKHKDQLVAGLNSLIGQFNTSLTPSPSGGGAPTGGGGGGGPISQEGSCPGGGETCQEDDQGRYDCTSVTWDSYESTWCGSFSGDDLTIKLYGPQHHSSGDCCWCVVHVKPGDGQFVMGGEGPHPGSNCEDKGDGQSIGSTSNICIKTVSTPGPTTVAYALVNGQWQEMVSYTGPCGCDQTSNEKTGNEVTFRCDGSFDTTCATVRPLGGAAYARRRKSLYGISSRTKKLRRAYRGDMKRAFAAYRR